MHGSGRLVRWLLENDLVDEMNLLIVPVVVGQGTRLFPDNGPDIALDLVESRAFPKGITAQVYRRPGVHSMQPAEARDIGDGLDDRSQPYGQDPPSPPTASAGVQRRLRRAGSFSTGVPESP